MYNNISPYLINSYFYCKNRAFIEKNFLFKSSHINLTIGSLYDKDNSKIKFDFFELDGIDKKNRLILEYKKSCSNHNGNVFQLLYYLYLTKNIYRNYCGKLICIESKKEEIVELNSKTEKELLDIIKEINNLNSFNENLFEEEKCIHCGYYDYCFS